MAATIEFRICGPYTHVVCIPDAAHNWPAWLRPDGSLVVDFRLFSNEVSEQKSLCVDELRQIGVPEAVIASAAASIPRGFALLPGRVLIDRTADMPPVTADGLVAGC